MDLNATAKLPDGTESRGAWIGWMIAGFFFGGFLAYNSISSAVFVEALSFVAQSMGSGILAVLLPWLAWPLDFILTGVLLGWLAGLLHRRMLMPCEVWLSMAALPVMASIVGMLVFGWGFIVPAITPVLALAVGWFFMGWLERRNGMSNKRIERTPRGRLT